ncbi:TPA: hypothetical protein ACH3X1_003823 [Trebouxia sp. C0004]
MSHRQTDQANSTIWLTLRPSQSQERPLVLGVCYIPQGSHHSVQLNHRPAHIRFESLTARIAQFSSGGHVLVAGDLHARVVQTCKVGAHRHESDHFPLELQLLLTAPTLPAAPPPPQAPTPIWMWDNSQRGPYADALLSGPYATLGRYPSWQLLLEEWKEGIPYLSTTIGTRKQTVPMAQLEQDWAEGVQRIGQREYRGGTGHQSRGVA